MVLARGEKPVGGTGWSGRNLKRDRLPGVIFPDSERKLAFVLGEPERFESHAVTVPHEAIELRADKVATAGKRRPDLGDDRAVHTEEGERCRLVLPGAANDRHLAAVGDDPPRGPGTVLHDDPP